jgi:hypothetical protein
MEALFSLNGGRPSKEPKFTAIAIPSFAAGFVSQRNVLHDPSEIAVQKFYNGKSDVLWTPSLNVEVTNDLTVRRRYGFSPFSAAIYSTSPNVTFGFELLDGSIQVIVDTGETPSFALTSVGSVTAGVSASTWPRTTVPSFVCPRPTRNSF